MSHKQCIQGKESVQVEMRMIDKVGIPPKFLKRYHIENEFKFLTLNT